MFLDSLFCRRRLLLPGIVISAALAAHPALAAKTGIGITSLVVEQVDGIRAELKRRLFRQDDVFQDEVVETGSRSASELHFADDTRITVGPNSRVVLDKFVYDPDPGEGAFALQVTQGVFRFFSGNMASSNYSIETPSVTVGVRGTIISGGVDPSTGAFGLILESADSQATVTTGSGETVVLDMPGTAAVALSDGSVAAGAAPPWLLGMVEGMDGVIAQAAIPVPPPGQEEKPEVVVAPAAAPAPEPVVETTERGLPRAVANHDPDDLPSGLKSAAVGNSDPKANHHATDPDGGPGGGNDKGKGGGKGRN